MPQPDAATRSPTGSPITYRIRETNFTFGPAAHDSNALSRLYSSPVNRHLIFSCQNGVRYLRLDVTSAD